MIKSENNYLEKIEISNGIVGIINECRALLNDMEEEIYSFFNDPSYENKESFLDWLDKYIYASKYIEDKIKNLFNGDK
ncbi:MAG TPA: hypothetical protein VNF93_02395 [Buchnera sp. (in: enterobacteria)]|nr:hypothetical protein [Buchnera sp. (in: enterobacteria)]